MSPRQQIANLYWRYPQPRTFDTDERLYRISGHVIETEDVFIMGKGVKLDAPVEMILSPHVSFPRSQHNAWFLFAMAGNLLSMYDAMPYHLPYVGWARRDGPVKWHLVEDARHHISSIVPMFVYRLAGERASII